MKALSLVSAATVLTASASLADSNAHTMDSYYHYLDNNEAEVETKIEQKLGLELSLVRLWPQNTLPKKYVTERNAAAACGEFNTPYNLKDAVRIMNHYVGEGKSPSVVFHATPTVEQGEEFICVPGAAYAFKLEPNR